MQKQGGVRMLGFDSLGVYFAYTFTILATLLCIVYGMVNWNKPKDEQKKEVEEEIKWEKKDKKI